jgi:hypothetical protein
MATIPTSSACKRMGLVKPESCPDPKLVTESKTCQINDIDMLFGLRDSFHSRH